GRGGARGRVSLHDAHVLGPDAEAVGRELRERRLVTLPVRLEPRRQRHRAVRLDRHADGVEVAGAREALVDGDLGRPAALLDEGAEADAEIAALPAEAALPVAKRVVVDELAGTADRGGIAAAVVAAAGCGDRRLAARFSYRSSTHFTGAPVRRDRSGRIASSTYRCTLRPKPPPTAGTSTRTRVSGSSWSAASIERTKNGICVELHTVRSPLQSA